MHAYEHYACEYKCVWGQGVGRGTLTGDKASIFMSHENWEKYMQYH